MNKAKKHKGSVLSDHKRQGKRLIPPYIAVLGNPSHISWVDTIIPEVLWIGLLLDRFGHQEGIALALAVAQAADNVAKGEKRLFFVGASDYLSLTQEEKALVASNLAKIKKLTQVQEALFPLVHFYPSFPLDFLSSADINRDPTEVLSCLKGVLFDLFDKNLRRTVLVQSTVVYIAFVLGRLKVTEGLALASFPEVERYPDTEMSRRVASAVRATVLSFFGTAEGKTTSKWSTEFWNQGLEIEKCSF